MMRSLFSWSRYLIWLAVISLLFAKVHHARYELDEQLEDAAEGLKEQGMTTGNEEHH